MWYTQKGEIVETVPKRGGGVKKATIKEARENGWVPRYSNVAGYKSNWSITEWRVETAIKVAQAQPGLSYDELVEFIDAESDVRMNRGAEIHKTIERHLTGQSTLLYKPVVEWIDEYIKTFDRTISEVPLITKWFGGTPDLIGYQGDVAFVVDFKTTSDIGKVKSPYDAWIMQTAAYEFAYQQIHPKTVFGQGEIVLIDQTTLECKKLSIPREKTDQAKIEFVALLYAWCIAHKMPVHNLKEYL